MECLECLHIQIKGIVQGVGFRPFIYNLAQRHSLAGWVLNGGDGVEIEIEGGFAATENFLKAIRSQPPPLAVIDSIAVNHVPVKGHIGFIIKKSLNNSTPQTLVSPDVATCPDCLAEIMDKHDNRYRYPFTNCTNCGPRYTIIHGLPYDRVNTTMVKFPMCPKCLKEYNEPTNRRFHAQPNACPICGPQYRLLNKDRQDVQSPFDGDILKKTRQTIKDGYIVAIKGIGGWHLAADAKNEQAVQKLRERKIRYDKPLAVMAGSLEQVKKLCAVSLEEEKLLTSSAGPIVLLAKSQDYSLPENLAPNNGYIGIMLPYAPVHYLLLDSDDVWIMTSANVSDEPTVYKDDEAFTLLASLADFFLSHDRDIYCRADDSVVRVIEENKRYFIRRSRGYVPSPVILPFKSQTGSVLAVGGELKNTFCLTRGQEAFLSAHMGDLENLASYNAYVQSIEHFINLLHVKPEIVACDRHPEYLSTKYALNTGLPVTPVQHHHAHIAAVLAEHRLNEQVIGVAFDGLGYGTDGKLWGGEILIADCRSFTRLGHCRYLALPGAAKAIQEPWRPALGMLYEIYGKSFDFMNSGLPLIKELPPGWELVLEAMDKGLNCPFTSSAGRLFDIAAALIGVKSDKNNYEGQAAVELELAARGLTGEVRPYLITDNQGMLELDFRSVFAAICEITLKNPNNIAYRAQLAADFHTTLAAAISELVSRASRLTGIKKAALSGGVFQNITLLKQVIKRLEKKGFIVYLPQQAPPNDGGLALGQAAVALQILEKGAVS